MELINNYILSLPLWRLESFYYLVLLTCYLLAFLFFTNYHKKKKTNLILPILGLVYIGLLGYSHYVIGSFFDSMNQSKYSLDSLNFKLRHSERAGISLKIEEIKIKCEKNESIKLCLSKLELK